MSEKRVDKPGFVIVRWGLHGAPYVRSPIYAQYSAALDACVNKDCELVVPWNETEVATLAGVKEHDWPPGAPR